jgi:hypothetical protein
MLTSTHQQELKASGIDPTLWDLNWRSVDGDDAWDLVWQDAKNDRFIQDGVTPREELKRRYAHLSEGGLWCNGCDPLNQRETMSWGQLKASSPRRKSDGKLIKYEAPFDTDKRFTFLRVSYEIWERVARRSGVAMPTDLLPSAQGYGLEFWNWVRDNEIPRVPTEGAKKAGFLLSQGYAGIDIPSVYNGFEKGTTNLKADLIQFAQKGSAWTIAFDCDAKKSTRRSVGGQVRKIAKALGDRGCLVSVASWDAAIGKGVDDFGMNGGDVHEVIATAEPLEVWSNRVDGGEISYPTHQLATVEVVATGFGGGKAKARKRYLADIHPPEDAKFWFLRAGKGLGKTETIARKLQELREKYPHKPIIVLTHRVKLGQALAGRFGVDFIEDHKSEIARFGGGYSADQGGVVLVADSLHSRSGARFAPEFWQDAIVVIDEVEQFCWHLLNSRTEVQRNRPEIIQNLSELLQNAFLVICMDADLTDLSIDYLIELSGDKGVNPWVGVCPHKSASGRKAVIYEESSPIVWFLDLKRAIESGEKAFVCLSGQAVNSKWGSQHLEYVFAQLFPHIKIGRIDGESVAETGHEFFQSLDDLDPKLKECDVVLATGVIETGVSIDLENHFDGVWICAWGLQTESGVRQFADRLRADVDRHVWAITRSPNSIQGGSAYPSILRRKLESVVSRAKAKVQEARENADEALALQLQKADDLSVRDNASSVRAWSRFAGRINASMKYYRRSIVAGLRRDGYEISIATNPYDKDAIELEKDFLSDSVEDFEGAVNDRIADHAIEPMPEKEFEKLDKAREMSKGDRERLHAEKVRRRYGVKITSDLVRADRRGYHGKISLQYFLTKGRKFVEKIDNHKLAKAGEYGGFLSDLARSLRLHKIEALEWLGLPELLEAALDPDRKFFDTDDDLIALRDRAIAASRDTSEKAKRQLGRYIHKLRQLPQTPDRDAMIAKYEADRANLNSSIQSYARDLFEIDPEKSKPVSILKHLFRKLGLKMSGGKKKGWQLETINDPRFEIFEVWHDEHTKMIEKWELEAAEELEADRERRAKLEEIAKLEAAPDLPAIVTEWNAVKATRDDREICQFIYDRRIDMESSGRWDMEKVKRIYEVTIAKLTQLQPAV